MTVVGYVVGDVVYRLIQEVGVVYGGRRCFVNDCRRREKGLARIMLVRPQDECQPFNYADML